MQTHRIGIGGLKVGYRVSPTPLAAFKAVLDDLGYSKYVPNPRTDSSALVATVKAKEGGKNRLIAGKGKPQKGKPAGVEVVDVERHLDTFNAYDPRNRFKVTGANGSTKVQRDDWDDEELTDAFLAEKAVLTTSAVNGAINAIMQQELAGIPSLTGTYVPEANVPAWKALAERLFGRWDSDGNQVAEGVCAGLYEPASVQLDEDTIRSIRERLRAEVTEESTNIALEVAGGTLNSTQIQTRCDRAQRLLEKIAVYDREFGAAQEDLRKVAEDANKMACYALLTELGGVGVGL
jgi:hypothetical protein